MRLEDYPPQEPLSAFAAKYQEAVLALGAGVEASAEAAYGADPYQRLLVFTPETRKATGDVLLFFHGGGWTNGYKEWMSFMAPPFQAHGVVFVSAGYRLAPAHTFPTGFEDCADAVTWVYQHIGDFGGDPERIFVGGHSAGGHYASLLALKDDWQAPRGLPRTTISGALPISGTYYFTEGSGLSVRPRFLGPVESGHEVDASPMQHLRADAPRFLIAHGSADFPHLSRQAQEFEQALRKVGVPAERLELQGCDHGSASTAATESPWLPRAVAWMRER